MGEKIWLLQVSFIAFLVKEVIVMLYEALKQEAVGLTEDKMYQLIEFARFLKSEVGTASPSENKPKRTFGSMKEDIIYIAPDFDSCFSDNPKAFGLEDYM